MPTRRLSPIVGSVCPAGFTPPPLELPCDGRQVQLEFWTVDVRVGASLM